MIKKYAFSLLCSAVFGLTACTGGEEESPVQPAPTPSSSDSPLPASSAPDVVNPDPNAGATPAPESSASQGGSAVVPSGNYAALAASADVMTPINMYQTWRPYHFTTMEYEGESIYPTLSDDFSIVFTAAYQPAGRIIWSNQTSYYKNQCQVTNATDRGMMFRGCTVSEGIGYGMLLSYFQNDDDAFVRLWNYSRAFRAYNKINLTPWITYSFRYNEIDNSSATDADLDIATALVLMYYKSGLNEAYLNDALTIINAIWTEEIEPNSLRIMSGNTSMWNGKNGKDFTYNLSYFSPVALRLFAKVDPSHNWTGVLDAMYEYMDKVQANGTGVFPDWSDSQGQAVNPPNSSAEKTYWLFDKESIRIPWRIAWDYYWFQEPRAAKVLNTLNTFISTKASGNPDSDALSTTYSWNLSVGADSKASVVSNGWYAAWCATGIAGNSAWLQSCTTGLNKRTVSNNATSYFNDILLVMYSQLLNGLFIKPF